ncbi:hypothetical protein Pmar_PMAR007769 [Perkinsus marinus ATCC 50983]|uniref:Uncharacterized protein n=1 Tax=Perkinsus marinus (strain ATCC 50983 / TXsc) TaxID=423536 RepID=C5KYT3_PERM5|nr:hypothetical protein Pmar_PMAR007769 [Perkinsus marinus ATCC 50983]EER10361.1 hypothetical protein Pmar_PMAR007769 [Perkinsus marinus ATCC 50983]|eukprot:XP_002778566.1 hypothetical protein Pmar_PMAR007769 [Perkinsus marinus ATCC 50983]
MVTLLGRPNLGAIIDTGKTGVSEVSTDDPLSPTIHTGLRSAHEAAGEASDATVPQRRVFQRYCGEADGLLIELTASDWPQSDPAMNMGTRETKNGASQRQSCPSVCLHRVLVHMRLPLRVYEQAFVRWDDPGGLLSGVTPLDRLILCNYGHHMMGKRKRVRVNPLY